MQLGVKYRPFVSYSVTVRRRGTHEGEYEELHAEAMLDERGEDGPGADQRIADDTLLPILAAMRKRRTSDI